MSPEEEAQYKAEIARAWDHAEAMASDVPWENIVGFIRHLRHLGFDKTLRPGHKVFLFILSRSLEHGLRPRQPHIVIDFTKGVEVCKVNYPKRKRFLYIHHPTLEITPELEGLLRELESLPID